MLPVGVVGLVCVLDCAPSGWRWGQTGTNHSGRDRLPCATSSRPGSAAPALDCYKDFCFSYQEIFHVSFIWPLLLYWKDIDAVKTHYQPHCSTDRAVLLLLWKSPVPIYTQISNIGQAVTIGNTFTSWKWPQNAEYLRSGAVLAIRWLQQCVTVRLICSSNYPEHGRGPTSKKINLLRYLYWFIDKKFFSDVLFQLGMPFEHLVDIFGLNEGIF